ncbi:hypothetical protein IMG5_006600 [Ichthyophthirius multifiliis]|uniref:Uncharacterized protein n=1 Tax=Ichthyophthirius multifiliis TaxID=5932 RepID=G0QJM4_ICHMU|nr:hypothetical protein IMG5_006600 [Ichthyophthirius multifiliis]EGR34574.1 hypothetical protein IMG5_006600 [Ichthyophthirius multifiliis]|eukprot:XP_004039878.1 hypothetical protein IMG5_006600 [Ichthyophthirius multifiliis]
MRKDYLDFSHFDKRFENNYEVVAPEFGDLQQKRAQFIAENAGKYRPEPFIPENINGLVKKTGRLPATRNWYRRSSSYERNGFLNYHTPVWNTKFIPWCTFIFLIWGWASFQVGGYNNERYADNGEKRNNLYWKLSNVEIPQSKLWNRPS